MFFSLVNVFLYIYVFFGMSTYLYSSSKCKKWYMTKNSTFGLIGQEYIHLYFIFTLLILLGFHNQDVSHLFPVENVGLLHKYFWLCLMKKILYCMSCDCMSLWVKLFCKKQYHIHEKLFFCIAEIQNPLKRNSNYWLWSKGHIIHELLYNKLEWSCFDWCTCSQNKTFIYLVITD